MASFNGMSDLRRSWWDKFFAWVTDSPRCILCRHDKVGEVVRYRDDGEYDMCLDEEACARRALGTLRPLT